MTRYDIQSFLPMALSAKSTVMAKKMGRKKHIFSSWIIAVTLLFTMVPTAHAATYDYAVEGGNLKFDPTTGTITDCDTSVYSADIPSEIYGVSVTTIGKYAFSNCKKLTSVSIPSTVAEIEMSAFNNCSQLTSVLIPNSVVTMGGSSSAVNSGVFYNCDKLESITVPGSVKRLSNYTFYGCDNLKTVVLEDGVEEIGRSAFGSCKSLVDITLPNSVTSIESRAFVECTNLKTISIGSGIKHIDDSAFVSTSSLENIYFRGNAPGATDKMINKFADGFMIYYPEGASGWTTPTWNGFITKSYTLPDAQPQQQPQTTEKVTAVPTSSTVLVSGYSVPFDAYNIKDSNYFKLRDLAFILSGSKVQFNVTWDDSLGAINMVSGQSYTPVGGEMSSNNGINQVGTLNMAKIYLDGNAVNMTAYNINGSNYFKLRDVGSLFNFSVEWDGANQTIVIDTSKSYAGN